jgi:hypothetical protein
VMGETMTQDVEIAWRGQQRRLRGILEVNIKVKRRGGVLIAGKWNLRMKFSSIGNR